MAERALRNLFWYLLIASRGGSTRARLVRELMKEPANINQLAERLGMDYKTIKHHIEILAAHGLITAEGLRYNVVYFPSQILEDNKDIFDEV
ncbi:MAG: winged helix-turn-helix domain-containing protein [Aigarchaeota archaeon]|nr:winged helix-turn-helix domain-containing protein [Candidatus Pelearchaeum maunauluense]